ncbi:hypothetical protein B566_EDAN010604 [Ephemera danica]|nr:hypothetical protein B566_EDAN010604 [Ephemera danica]
MDRTATAASTYWEDHRNNFTNNNNQQQSTSSANQVKFESLPAEQGVNNRQCKEEQSIFRYCERNLNFSATVSPDDDEYGYQKKKALARDPMSHRIIEKRRRDRMNNCLADLSRLIPAEYLKKGRGRVEKTEIIEMAIKHMTHLQKHATCSHVNNSGQGETET